MISPPLDYTVVISSRIMVTAVIFPSIDDTGVLSPPTDPGVLSPKSAEPYFTTCHSTSPHLNAGPRKVWRDGHELE